MKAIAKLRREHSGVVIVEATDGDGVIEQDAVVCDVENVRGEAPILAECATS